MSKTAIQGIKQVITHNNDETLVALAKASLKDGAVPASQTRDLQVVQWAIIEVLTERHPEIMPALDEWELDLDGDRSQIQVAIDWMEANR